MPSQKPWKPRNVNNKRLLTGLLVLATALSCTPTYDVVVIGGGAGGSMAAIEGFLW